MPGSEAQSVEQAPLKREDAGSKPVRPTGLSWTIGAVGSVPARHAGGRGFKSLIVHMAALSRPAVRSRPAVLSRPHAWRSGSASRSHREGRGFNSLSVHYSGIGPVGSARALGARGREFKSHIPDQQPESPRPLACSQDVGPPAAQGVTQVASAHVWRARGHWFEPGHPDSRSTGATGERT